MAFVNTLICISLCLVAPKLVFAQAQLEGFSGDASAVELVASDLKEIESMRLTEVTPFFEKVFGGRDMKSVTNFFRHRVDHITWMRGDPMVMAQASIGGSSMELGMNIKDRQKSALIRVAIYLHEATHSSGAYDASCIGQTTLAGNVFSSPDLAGRRGCGEGLSETYAISYLFLRTVVQFCDQCSQRQKMEAALFADYQSLLRIENTGMRNELLKLSNSDPIEAEALAAQAILKKKNSKLNFDVWIVKCLSELSCY